MTNKLVKQCSNVLQSDGTRVHSGDERLQLDFKNNFYGFFSFKLSV